MLKTVFLVIQIFLAIGVGFLILLQGKGAGLDRPFLGNIGAYSTRRGVEKVIFYLTVVLASLFFLSSLAQLLIG